MISTISMFMFTVAKLDPNDGESKTHIPKNFYRTEGTKTYIPKNFYTKTTYIPLLSEKFITPPPPPPLLYFAPTCLVNLHLEYCLHCPDSPSYLFNIDTMCPRKRPSPPISAVQSVGKERGWKYFLLFFSYTCTWSSRES
ncbi:hypothetical protein Hanom_Chr17g01568561 [Helianthus anomalus]